MRNNIRNEINSNAKFKELSGKLTEKKLKELNNSIVDGIINLINDPTSKNLSLCALVGICYEIAKSAGASKSQLTFLINAKSLFEFKITFNQIMGSDTAFEKVSEFSKEIIEYALSKYFFLLAEANPKVKQQLPILLESVRRTMEKLLREQQERLLVEQKEKAKKISNQIGYQHGFLNEA
ncbi:MAG: hypothetical protein QW275_00510 [Candidatus Anstonellaceae archaeon]